MSRASDSHRHPVDIFFQWARGNPIMQTYFVRRVGIAADARQLDSALRRLRSFEETSSILNARWLHSYALRETDGQFGLACFFEADTARTLHRHAESINLPATEIRPVSRTLVVRRFAPTMVYFIRRRHVWRTASELELGAAYFRRLDEGESARQVSWLRSYAVREDDGTLGSVCLFQGVDPAAVADHAVRARTAADEITPVIGRIVYRAGLDEQRAASAALA
jgi:hypothetical protein